MTDITDNSVIKNLKRAYLFAMIVLLIFMTICASIIIQAIDKNVSNSDIINVAGRQRMLSQNINKCAFGLYLSDSDVDAARYLDELETSLTLWSSVHKEFGLKTDNKNLFSYDVMRIYERISYHQNVIAGAAADIIAISDRPGFDKEDLKQPINVISENEQEFLSGMDDIVNHLDQLSKDSIIRSRNIVFILLAAAFVFLICIIIFIFKPVQKFIAGSIEEINKSHEKIKILAMTDELTGLHNRNFLNSVVYRTINNADRYQHDISFLLLDLDFFKRVNDTYGHPVGDSVLKNVARLINESLRDSDLPVRMGGEEFVILLPETDLEQALTVAERIRSSIAGYKFEVIGTQTVSIGLSKRMSGESFENWYTRTDIALYDAKKQGRNRVVSAIEKKPGHVEIYKDWSPELESGNEIIDGQHRALLESGKQILSEEFRIQDKENQLEKFDQLFEAVAKHFSDEESEMLNAGFLRLESHAEHHKELLKKAEWIKKAFVEDRLNADVLVSFLWDDVIHGHIINEDMIFISYLREKRMDTGENN